MEWRYIYKRDEMERMCLKWNGSELWRNYTLTDNMRNFLNTYNTLESVDTPKKVQGGHFYRDRKNKHYKSNMMGVNTHVSVQTSKSADYQNFVKTGWKTVQVMQDKTNTDKMDYYIRGVRSIFNKMVPTNVDILMDEWKVWFIKEGKNIGSMACWITLLEWSNKTHTESKMDSEWISKVLTRFEGVFFDETNVEKMGIIPVQFESWRDDWNTSKIPFFEFVDALKDCPFQEAYYKWYVLWFDWVFSKGCFRKMAFFDQETDNQWDLFGLNKWQQWVKLCVQYIKLRRLPASYLNRLVHLWETDVSVPVQVPVDFPEWFLIQWHATCMGAISTCLDSETSKKWDIYFYDKYGTEVMNMEHLPFQVSLYWKDRYQNQNKTADKKRGGGHRAPRNRKQGVKTQEIKQLEPVNFTNEDYSNLRCLWIEWSENGYQSCLVSYIPERAKKDCTAEYFEKIWNSWLEISIDMIGLFSLEKNEEWIACTQWLLGLFPVSKCIYLNEWKTSGYLKWEAYELDYTWDDLRHVFMQIIVFFTNG